VGRRLPVLHLHSVFPRPDSSSHVILQMQLAVLVTGIAEAHTHAVQFCSAGAQSQTRLVMLISAASALQVSGKEFRHTDELYKRKPRDTF